MSRVAMAALLIAVVTTPALPQDRVPLQASSFGRLPLTFEKNTGRYDKRVKFLTRAGGATVFLTDTEAVMVLPSKPRGQRQEAGDQKQYTQGECAVGANRSLGQPIAGGPDVGRDRFGRPSREGEPTGAVRSSRTPSHDGPVDSPLRTTAHVLRMKLVGANAKATVTGLQKQPGIVNYFIGNDPKKWRTRVPTYAKAKFAGVYPGIDVVYYGAEARGKGQEARAGNTGSLSALSSQLSSMTSSSVPARTRSASGSPSRAPTESASPAAISSCPHQQATCA